MENKEFERVKIYFDEEKYNNDIQKLEDEKIKYQNTINRIINLGLDIDFTPADFQKLYQYPRPFFVEKIVKEPLSIGGIEIDKNKAFDLLQLPEELPKIINEIKHSTRPDFNIFYLENNKIKIKDEYKEKAKENRTLYAETERQKQVFDALTKIVEGYNELAKIRSHFNPEFVLQRWVEVHYNNGTCSIKHNKIKEV